MSNDAMLEQNVTVEWGVHWVGDDEVEQENGSEVYARGVAQRYPNAATVVSRTVTRGPWTAAS
jgi:hypothetical protein